MYSVGQAVRLTLFLCLIFGAAFLALFGAADAYDLHFGDTGGNGDLEAVPGGWSYSPDGTSAYTGGDELLSVYGGSGTIDALTFTSSGSASFPVFGQSALTGNWQNLGNVLIGSSGGSAALSLGGQSFSMLGFSGIPPGTGISATGPGPINPNSGPPAAPPPSGGGIMGQFDLDLTLVRDGIIGLLLALIAIALCLFGGYWLLRLIRGESPQVEPVNRSARR